MNLTSRSRISRAAAAAIGALAVALAAWSAPLLLACTNNPPEREECRDGVYCDGACRSPRECSASPDAASDEDAGADRR